MHLYIFILSFLTSAVFPTTKADDNKSAFMDFIEQVSLVIQLEDMKPLIDPEAYLAFNSEYESYFEVLSDENYRQQVNNLLMAKVNVAKSRIDDECGTGFVFLTGNSKSGEQVNHTFSLKKSKEGLFKILHWHTG